MNLKSASMAGCGPAAWNRGGIEAPVSVNIHAAKHTEGNHTAHVNPDTQAMAEARGELHQHHWPIGLEHQ